MSENRQTLKNSPKNDRNSPAEIKKIILEASKVAGKTSKKTIPKAARIVVKNVKKPKR